MLHQITVLIMDFIGGYIGFRCVGILILFGILWTTVECYSASLWRAATCVLHLLLFRRIPDIFFSDFPGFWRQNSFWRNPPNNIVFWVWIFIGGPTIVNSLAEFFSQVVGLRIQFSHLDGNYIKIGFIDLENGFMCTVQVHLIVLDPNYSSSPSFLVLPRLSCRDD